MTTSGDSDVPAIDTTTPHSARIWNYWLDGKDNYDADRQVGRQIAADYPELIVIARHSRAFLVRVVTHLAREAGIRQFLDLGAGIPTAENVHQIAQREAPEARVVYVDNDPLVRAHFSALMTSTPQGATALVAGLELLPPGIVPIPHWHPEQPEPEGSPQFGGLAR